MTKIRNADLVTTYINVSGLFLVLFLVFCWLGDDEGEEDDAPYKLITNLWYVLKKGCSGVLRRMKS